MKFTFKFQDIHLVKIFGLHTYKCLFLYSIFDECSAVTLGLQVRSVLFTSPILNSSEGMKICCFLSYFSFNSLSVIYNPLGRYYVNLPEKIPDTRVSFKYNFSLMESLILQVYPIKIS